MSSESNSGSLTNLSCLTYYFLPYFIRQPSRLVGKVCVVVDKRRVDGSRVRLAEVEVGDETGVVSLRARDEQIDVLQDVSKRSGAVVLRNCMLELYQGKHIRLAVTKWGKLNTYPDSVASTPPPPSKMNLERNFSLIDLSLVASESSTFHAPPPTAAVQSSGGGGGPTQQDATSRTITPSKSSPPTSSASPSASGSRQSKRGSGRGGGGAKYQGRGGGSGRGTATKHAAHQQPPMHPGLHHPYADPAATYGIHAAAAAGVVGWHPNQHGHGQHNVGHETSAAAATTMEVVPSSYAQHAYHHHLLHPAHHAPAPGMSATEQQQLLLRQQYELQQRQLMHLYHEQRQMVATAAADQQQHQQHHIHPHHQQQQQQHHHNLGRSGSFEQAAAAVPEVGSNSSHMQPMSAMPSSTAQQQQPQQSRAQQQQQQQQEGAGSSRHRQQQQQQQRSLTDPPMSPNKMNPQAATFAPSSYMNLPCKFVRKRMNPFKVYYFASFLIICITVLQLILLYLSRPFTANASAAAATTIFFFYN
jgi:hypothetical protein